MILHGKIPINPNIRGFLLGGLCDAFEADHFPVTRENGVLTVDIDQWLPFGLPARGHALEHVDFELLEGADFLGYKFKVNYSLFFIMVAAVTIFFGVMTFWDQGFFALEGVLKGCLLFLIPVLAIFYLGSALMLRFSVLGYARSVVRKLERSRS